MPRKRRENFQPVIYVPDISEQACDVNKYLESSGCSASVFLKGQHVFDSSYVKIFDSNTIQMLGWVKKEHPGLDSGFVLFLMLFLINTKTKTVLKDGDLVIEDRLVRYFRETREFPHIAVRFMRVGCRVETPLKQIIEVYGCSESFAHKQIRIMKDSDIIIDGGRGVLDEDGISLGNAFWYELNPILCWKGGFVERICYIRQYVESHGVPSFCDDEMTDNILYVTNLNDESMMNCEGNPKTSIDCTTTAVIQSGVNI